jgi:hypothetical protein
MECYVCGKEVDEKEHYFALLEHIEKVEDNAVSVFDARTVAVAHIKCRFQVEQV